MKHTPLASLVLFCLIGINARADRKPASEKIILENDKVRVTEYISSPRQDICGKGTHTHGPRLTTLITDAAMIVTGADGQQSERTLPAGTAFWSDAETHMVKNRGRELVRLQMVEIK